MRLPRGSPGEWGHSEVSDVVRPPASPRINPGAAGSCPPLRTDLTIPGGLQVDSNSTWYKAFQCFPVSRLLHSLTGWELTAP